LPVQALAEASARAHARYGAEMYQYGWQAGPLELLARMQIRIAQREGRSPRDAEMCLTAGNSWALDQIATLFAPPGDAILVENPTYHYAVKILRDHVNPLVAVDADADGLRPDALQSALDALAQRGQRAACLYLVPTFNNPTGRNLSAARRTQVIEIAARHGLLVIEDDVYRELAYDAPAPPSLWSLDRHDVVIRMMSFAKSLAPGLRMGLITGPERVTRRMFEGGVLDSGGGIVHHAAYTVAELDATGALDVATRQLASAYRERRDALVSALEASLPDGYRVERPGGGFFVWVHTPMPSAQLLPHADREAVAFVPGQKFFLSGGNDHALRLSFSLYPPDQLREGAERLGRAAAACR
jgi:2-aminoadipate transaminase